MTAQRDVFFSIVLPAYNEEAGIAETVRAITAAFDGEGIRDYEILVINDNSTDGTEVVLQRLCAEYPGVRYLNSANPHGYGYTVRYGLDHFAGQAVCIVMADLSDAPEDILTYYRLMKRGAECVFGSRFIRHSRVYDYPRVKYVVNRLANWFIMIIFGLRHNDITNAFKCFRREVIVGLKPLISPHFNLTVEMPLKAIVRGFSYETVPISWRNRKKGCSKLNMHEMGSRYLFVVLYILIEKWFSGGDYRRR